MERAGMSTTALRAVIFDLDGVLTDTAEYHYRAWQDLADEEGIPFDRQANEALRGLSRRESLLTMLGDRQVDEDRLEDMMDRKNRAYVTSLQDMSPDDLLPGALALIEQAEQLGLATAIGSSSKNAPFVLDKLGIRDRFAAISDGNTVERAKPAPDLFLAAAELLEVPPAACIVVEDAASGVDAALAAGMVALGVGPEERVGHAHHVFPTTADVDLSLVLTSWSARPPEVRDRP
jgi:beta-phosphoglucomutase